MTASDPAERTVHEDRTGHTVYEATDYYSTTLPGIDHNEDDNDFEEWQQGYEEKEIGTSMPENIAEGTYYWAYTG